MSDIAPTPTELSFAINGNTFTDRCSYYFTRSFCGNNDGRSNAIKGWIVCDPQSEMVKVYWQQNDNRQYELMDKHDFAQTVYVGTFICEPPHSIPLQTFEFRRLWANIIYFKHIARTGVLVSERMYPHLVEIQFWDEVGAFSFLNKGDMPILHFLWGRATEQGFNIRVESHCIMLQIPLILKNMELDNELYLQTMKNDLQDEEMHTLRERLRDLEQMQQHQLHQPQPPLPQPQSSSFSSSSSSSSFSSDPGPDNSNKRQKRDHT